MWFRRKPNDEEVQLCETDIATLMAATPFTGAQSVLLRSVVQLRASQLGDLSGEYWCQVAKTIEGDQTILSNSSSVLSIRSSQYYKHLDNCKVGSVFLEISFTSPSVEFSSPPVTTEEFFCSNSTADGPSVEPERVDDSFILPRMWVYILAPVIAAVLILIFLILLIATCVQKRGSKRKHPSIIGRSCQERDIIIAIDVASRLYDYRPCMVLLES